MKDPIVEEVRRTRETRAQQFHYDLDALREDLRTPEKTAGHPTVSLPPKRVAQRKETL